MDDEQIQEEYEQDKIDLQEKEYEDELRMRIVLNELEIKPLKNIIMLREKDVMDLIREAPIYLMNYHEGAVLRTEIKEGVLRIYLKFKDGEESETNHQSRIFNNAFIKYNLISKEEYENF